jgi:hypothetical protein
MKLGHPTILDGPPARLVGPPRPTFTQSTNSTPYKYPLLLPVESVSLATKVLPSLVLVE